MFSSLSIPFLTYLLGVRKYEEVTQEEAEKELKQEAKRLYLHIFVMAFIASLLTIFLFKR